MMLHVTHWLVWFLWYIYVFLHLYPLIIWLVVLSNTPLKNHGVRTSWDDFSIPNLWKVIKKCSKWHQPCMVFGVWRFHGDSMSFLQLGVPCYVRCSWLSCCLHNSKNYGDIYIYIYIYIELVTTLYAAGILSDNCSQFANWEATM